MKFLSPSVLALSVMLASAAATVLPQPAVAAEKAKKAAPLKLSEPVRKLLAAAEVSLKAKDFPAARASLDQALAIATQPDDQLIVNQMLFNVGIQTKDQALQYKSLDGMVASGRISDADRPKVLGALGQYAVVAGDYAKAETILDESLRLAPSSEGMIFSAEAKYRLKKPAEASALVIRALTMDQASGTAFPEQWIKKGMSFAFAAKSNADLIKLSTIWLRAYPAQGNWREVIEIYRQAFTLDTETHLDFMRLQRAAGALRGEKDFVELAESTYLKFPNEAKSVLEQGIAAGLLDRSKNRVASEFLTISSGKVGADKASLSKNAPNARLAVANADAYASYRDYPSAIELYRKALTLGGADANLVNTRLGVALALSGQKEEAKQAFAKVTGQRGDLATLWMVFIDQPPVSTPAA